MQVVERVWEWHFAASPDALWPLLADTARIGEAAGFPRYTIADTEQPDGTVRRIGSARRFGMTVTWDEEVPEWIAGRWYSHERRFHSRLISRLASRIEFTPALEGDAATGGTLVRYRSAITASWPVALVLRLGGMKKFGRVLDRLFREAAALADMILPQLAPATAAAVPSAVRDRVAAQAKALAERGHGLAHRLADHLLDAPETELERIRPRALARRWRETPRAVIEACLAAVHEGLLTMRWDLVCPRCRGAKLTATSLDQLPQGAHCSSCNIDYDRDFTRNVEVTFEPAASVRELGFGSYCLSNPLLSEHVKVQQHLDPGAAATIAVDLPDGDYRARTVEPGGTADFTVAGGRIPQIALTDGDPVLGKTGVPGQVLARNDGEAARTLVVEDRRWAQDALTAHEATTMQAFRDLFADAALRPGDQVGIARIAFLFTDIKGSSDLYNQVGDARAYGFVREHYAVLTRAVREHDGGVVKTIGDAVMAAFADPAAALDAALAIRDDIAALNREAANSAGGAVALVVKLGLHCGPCIAVTLNDRLDYFGRTVNLAARLQNESLGGDIVLSEALAGEPGVAQRLAALDAATDTALVKGFAEPVALRRILAVE